MPQPNLANKKHPSESTLGSADTDSLTCAHWMIARPKIIKPRESVAAARALLEEHRINQLPVVKNGILVGIVTDRDLRDAVNTVANAA